MSRIHQLAAMAMTMLLSASLVGAEPQRGGGGGGGGGQRRAEPRDGARPAPRPGGGGVVNGSRPYYGTRGSYVFVGGYFYDPFYGPYPWWPRSAYYGGYYPVFDYRAEVRIQATPRDAAVYVDGFYAGIVDDFDGTFQRLPLTPGGHRIELFMEGFRTVRRNLYVQPGSTMKMHETLVPLAGGEKSQPPELAPPVPAPPDGTYNAPRGRAPRGAGAPPDGGGPPPIVRRGGGRVQRDDAEGFGTLVLHIQPREAEVSVDGQRWMTSGEGEFEIQLPAGRHRVEVELQGFQRFSSEIEVREDRPTPVNISLARGR